MGSLRIHPWPCVQASAIGVLDDIHDCRLRMFLIERTGLKPAAPELSLSQSALAGVEPAGLPDGTGKSAGGLWHEDGMNVIGHETEGTKLHLIARTIQPQELLITPIVDLIAKQGGARPGAMHRMMRDTGHHDARKSGHPSALPEMGVPMARDFDASRDPHSLMLEDIIEESRQCMSAAGSAG